MLLKWHVLAWCSIWYIFAVDHFGILEIAFFGLIVLAPWWWLNRSDVFTRTGHDAWLSLNIFNWLKFIIIFLKEFTIANISLFKLIWFTKDLPQDGWINVVTKSNSGIGRILIANFISLTPGTIAWNIDAGEEESSISVHIINMNTKNEVQNLINKIDPIVKKLTEESVK